MQVNLKTSVSFHRRVNASRGAGHTHLLEPSGLLSGMLKRRRVGVGGTLASLGSWDRERREFVHSVNGANTHLHVVQSTVY